LATTATVQLGDRSFPVVPQKHARLRHHLSGEDFQLLFSKDYSAVGYRLLSVLIPAVTHPGGMEQFEFEGFTSESAWQAYMAGDRDAYDENNDPSPTTDQIVEAMEKALMVNGAGRLGKLLNLIETAGEMQKGAATKATPTPLSPASPGGNGESPSTVTGTNPPTSVPNGG
jgi:hypothetical protein